MNDPYAFEPNMRDGRYVFLPDDVYHQGIEVCVSKQISGLLEIGHFWYPSEFTENKAIDIDGQIKRNGEGLIEFMQHIMQ